MAIGRPRCPTCTGTGFVRFPAGPTVRCHCVYQRLLVRLDWQLYRVRNAQRHEVTKEGRCVARQLRVRRLHRARPRSKFEDNADVRERAAWAHARPGTGE